MSDLGLESLEEIELKLRGYEQNLISVRMALSADPESEELSRLQKDLEEVISFFKDLAAKKKAERQRDVEPATAALALLGRACLITSTMQHGIIRSLNAVDPETKLPTILSIEILGTSDGGLTEEVYYHDLPINQLRLLNPMRKENLVLGMTCEGLYGGDGQWYAATVKEIRDREIVIEYTDYGEEDTLPYDRVRKSNPRKSASTGGSRSDIAVLDKERKNKTIVTPSGYVIPASLIVRPGDSDAIKAQKRKKLETIKREQKAKREEEEARARQFTWRAHTEQARTAAKFQTALFRKSR